MILLHCLTTRTRNRRKSKNAVIPALGDRARVTPLAPAFKVEPKDSGCIRIDPTGSQVSFTLTPTQGGTFDVGADVALYDTSDCSGTPIPKGTTTLKVQVVVKRAGQFLDVFWQELLKFWGVIIALFFAVIVFLIRKQLKKWIAKHHPEYNEDFEEEFK